MATTNDQLITEFIAVDKMTPSFEKFYNAYEKLFNEQQKLYDQIDKMQRHQQQFDKLQKSIDNVANSVKNVGSMIAGAFAFDKITEGISAATEKVSEFGKKAVEEAGKIERITATFAALNAAGNKGSPASADGTATMLDNLQHAEEITKRIAAFNTTGSSMNSMMDSLSSLSNRNAASSVLGDTSKALSNIKDAEVVLNRIGAINSVGNKMLDSIENADSTVKRIESLREAAYKMYGTAAIPGGIDSMQAPSSATPGIGNDAHSSAMSKAAEQMKYIQKFAQAALGQFDDLADAATKLEASGLVMQRWLPLVSNVAGAFGATKEKIDSISDALGKLASGSSGEALERLREFGITRTALENVGIKFDGGGQLKSSVSDTLLAVEKIANDKFGKIADYMSGTFEQRFSNIGDAWNNLLNNFGKAWLPVIGKLMDSVQSFISFLSDSGWINDLSTKMAGVFDSITGSGKVPEWVFTVMAAVENLPDLMSKTWDTAKKIGEALSNGFVMAYNFAGKLFTDVINTFQNGLIMATDRINETIYNMIKTLASVDWVGLLTSKPAKMIRDIAADAILPGSSYLIDTLDKSNPTKNALDTIDKFMTGGAEHKPMQNFTPIKDPSEVFGRMFGTNAFGNWMETTQKNGAALSKKYDQYQANDKNAEGMDPSKYGMFNDSYIKTADKTNSLMGLIEKNTERTAKAAEKIDLKNYQWGGGSMAQNGISFLDVESRVPSSGGPNQTRITLNFAGARDGFDRAMVDVVTDVVGQLSRAGLLTGGAY